MTPNPPGTPPAHATGTDARFPLDTKIVVSEDLIVFYHGTYVRIMSLCDEITLIVTVKEIDSLIEALAKFKRQAEQKK